MNPKSVNPVLSPRPLSDNPATLKEKILAILQADPFINRVLVIAISIGFFHGWLKIKFPHPVTTFLFDVFLGLALTLSFLKLKRRQSFIPKGAIGGALKAFYIVCVIYAILPLGPPLLVSVAALRGWCFPTLMFCLGYHLTKNLQQVRGYFYVLILLGVITAAYGLQQTTEEIEKQKEQDENFAERYKFTYYDKGGGERQFRHFSTFVSAGVFGNVMAYVSVFAIVLISDRKTGNRERLLLIPATGLMCYGIMLSGARTSFISLGLGLLVIAWYRRNFQNFVIIPAAIYVALKIAASVTAGAASDRFSSLLKIGDVIERVFIPTYLGWNFMMDHLFGGGLGKSGYSVPFVFLEKVNYTDRYWVDGDLGCLMIEMGIIGLLFFGRLIWAAIKTAYTSLDRLRDTPVSTVALASAACLVLALGHFPIGAPFLSIPMGAMVWFFLGTLQKLSDQHHAQPATQTAPTADAAAPAKKYLYYRPKQSDRAVSQRSLRS